jgi:hypothetical protein
MLVERSCNEVFYEIVDISSLYKNRRGVDAPFVIESIVIKSVELKNLVQATLEFINQFKPCTYLNLYISTLSWRNFSTLSWRNNVGLIVII